MGRRGSQAFMPRVLRQRCNPRLGFEIMKGSLLDNLNWWRKIIANVSSSPPQAMMLSHGISISS